MKQHFAESGVVFSGKAMSQESVPSEYGFANGRNDTKTQFQMIESFKGNNTETLDVISSEWFWGYDFNKGSEYVVFAYYDDNSDLRHQLCTPTSLLEDADMVKIRQTSSFDESFSITQKQAQYNIPYKITNGVIDDATLSCEDGSLLLHITASNEYDVNLILDLPRNVLDPKTNGRDDMFIVLGNGQEIEYEEVSYAKHRKLSMSFSADTNEIEIIQSFIPELKPKMCEAVHDPPYSYMLPPLIQFNSDIPFNEIECKQNLVLAQKYDGSPACVTESTKTKLVERDWTTNNSSTQIIFHDKPLNYWKNLNNDELRNYNSQLEGDSFYYELGNILAEEFFEEQLKQNNIHYTGEIIVRSGFALQPDPPIIGYYGIINATNGNTYMLNTSVNGNVVGRYFELQQLVFDKDILDSLSDSKPILFVNKFEKTPTVRIFTEEQDDKLEPHSVIIDFSKTDTVNFVNDSTYPVRVQEVGENKVDEIPENAWHTKTVSPGDAISVQFNSTGFYEFNVKKITDRFPNYYEHHGSGEIVVFTENMTDYTFGEGLLMGRVFVQNEPRNEIPWEGIGAGNNRGLEISLVDSVKHAIPDAEEYYLAKIKSLIPFDVNVIIE